MGAEDLHVVKDDWLALHKFFANGASLDACLLVYLVELCEKF